MMQRGSSKGIRLVSIALGWSLGIAIWGLVLSPALGQLNNLSVTGFLALCSIWVVTCPGLSAPATILAGGIGLAISTARRSTLRSLGFGPANVVTFAVCPSLQSSCLPALQTVMPAKLRVMPIGAIDLPIPAVSLFTLTLGTAWLVRGAAHPSRGLLLVAGSLSGSACDWTNTRPPHRWPWSCSTIPRIR